jgi:hypothetical protein
MMNPRVRAVIVDASVLIVLAAPHPYPVIQSNASVFLSALFMRAERKIY